MGVCDVPVISAVCDTAGEAAATLISAPFDWLASAMGEAAGWLIEAMWSVFDSTTMVDVTSEGYLAVYNLLFGIAVMIVLIFFCLQLTLGLIRREPTALSRAALGAAKAVLGSFVVITLTALALEIVDQLSIGIVQAAGETTESMGDKIMLMAAGLTAINIGAPGVGAIVTIFLAGLMIAAVAIVWFSLLIRKALLLIAIVLAPIAFAGAAWDSTRGWIGKWAAFVLALIVSKLVLVVIFLIAITQMATPIEADLTAVTEPIAGIVMLFIAAFAPYMVYKVIAFLGFDLYQTMGTEQEAKQSLNRPVPVPNKSQGEGPKQVLDGQNGGGGGNGNSGGGGSGPKPSPKNAPASSTGSSAGAGTGAASAGTGASGAGAGAAAGPAAVAVVGTKAAKDSAEAGPKAGNAVGEQAETAADNAGHTGNNSNTSTGGSSTGQQTGPDNAGHQPSSATRPTRPTLSTDAPGTSDSGAESRSPQSQPGQSSTRQPSAPTSSDSSVNPNPPDPPQRGTPPDPVLASKPGTASKPAQPRASKTSRQG